ncbi:MAG: TIM barrel protein [Phycisphaerales bacterium]
MQRRDFLATTAAAGLAVAIPARAQARQQPGAAPSAPGMFKLNYAPHLGMFKHHAGEDPLDQLRFMADEGFRAFEDNGMADRPPELQSKMGDEMEKLGIAMGVFVVSPATSWKNGIAKADKAAQDQFLADCRRAIEVAKRTRATWMTVVPGTLEPRMEMGYQTAHVIDLLRRGSEVLQPHNLVMVLEPLNPWRDHPNMFLSKVPQAHMVCAAVNSPACKILFDLYHQQITEGNLIPNIDLAWQHTPYFQIGDNPGRNEPGTGEINYRNIFKHIHSKGFKGILGMEHGNSKPGKEGERAVIDAYRAADSF